jgi:exodeoxyribonuclease VII large subunit
MSTEMKQKDIMHSNVPELSVSQLAFSLKKTLEESYGRIRVKGELSGLKLAASGHLYGDIKDEDANINIICWKGTYSKLSIKPEEGLEVIVTGKVSSYPKSSRYQIIIDSIELAGEGALLKMLEERRKKLAGEGLFDQERKKPLPFLPGVIGVITSPTGSVIKDIMHRLADRFPTHVLLYPVPVQGDGAADKIANALNAFTSMKENQKTPRPDVIIIARGGGSLEDLMPFNEESVIRAASKCPIPIISAVGHETDTTLIDYVSDVRAPTPTGAAEICVPVRANLISQTIDLEGRLMTSMLRTVSEKRSRLEKQEARLGDPEKLLLLKTQHLDFITHKASSFFEKLTNHKKLLLKDLSAKIRTPENIIREKTQQLTFEKEKLKKAIEHQKHDASQKAVILYDKLEILSFKNVLNRGYTVIRDADNTPITDPSRIRTNQNIQIEFKDNKRIQAITKNNGVHKSVKKGKTDKDQGDLF